MELSNVDLNIQTGADFINSTTINVDTFTIIAGDDFTNKLGRLDADTVTIEVTNFANDIANTGTISATSLNLIVTDDLTLFDLTGFNNFRNLDISTDGNFTNFSDFDLDNWTINAGGTFSHNNIITAGNFTATVGTYFNNSSIINAASFTATVGEDFNNTSGGRINADSFTLTASNFYNSNTSNSVNQTINATSFTATVSGIFGNYGSNGFNAYINATNLTVTANDFQITGTATIDAATVTIKVPNFASNIDNAEGNVSSDSLNFILTDDFTHASDSFTGFTFNNLDYYHGRCIY